MEQDYKEPAYTIGIASKKLGVCSATLRIWEKKKLIKPSRIGKNRFYSKCDMDRLERIKELLQNKHINIEGARNILNATRCWEVKKCKPGERDNCRVYLRYGNA